MAALNSPGAGRRYGVVTVLYLFIAVINLSNYGWRDVRWIGWVLLGAAFWLWGRVPPVRAGSFPQSIRDPRGLAAFLCAVASLVLLFWRMLSR